MDKKFHVNNKGEVNPCSAQPGKCPYSAYRHFTKKEDALKYADTENRAINEYTKITSMTDQELQKKFGISNREIAKLAELKYLLKRIDRNKLTEGTVDPKLYSSHDLDNPDKFNELQQIVDAALPGSKLDKSTHLIGEDNKFIYIWTNLSSARDVIIFDKQFLDRFPITEIKKYQMENGRVASTKHIEIKNLATKNNGAQLSDTKLILGENSVGLYTKESSKAITSKIANQLQKWDPRNDSYSNKVINVSEEEAQEYLLRDYYEKGASELTIYKSDQSFLTINLADYDKKPELLEKAKNTLKENGISIELNVRNNNISKKLTKKDKERFLKDYGCMFKDGIAKEKFTIDDLKCSKIDATPQGIGQGEAYIRQRRKIPRLQTYGGTETARKTADPFIRLGEFRLKFKDEDFIKSDREFTLDDFEIMVPHLTGSIKEK